MDDTSIPKPLSRRLLQWLLFAFASAIVLTALFYGVEDIRGWYAWQRYRTDSAARGVKLNWSAYVPAAVPDEENFFKAPHMQAWFVGRGNTTFSTRISSQKYLHSDGKNRSLAQVTIVPANAQVKPGDADIVLQYNYPTLTVADDSVAAPVAALPPDAIPLIVMDEVPLHDAIKNLAYQAGEKYVTEDKLGPLNTTVTIRWRNVTALNGLVALLHNYGLEWNIDAHTDCRRIAKKISYGPTTNAASPLPACVNQEVIPLIVMDEVLLHDAIKNLAYQAGLNYLVDPAIEPLKDTVAIRWEKTSAMNALAALLHQHNLACYPDSATGIARITRADGSKSVVNVEPSVKTKLARLLANAVDTAPDGKAEAHLSGATGIELCAVPLRQIKPARIVVRTDWIPDAREIKDFFSANPFTENTNSTIPSICEISAVRDGNSFNIFLDKPGLVNAADYLAWSDQFAGDMAEIDAALQLPFARMDGDYNEPLSIPIPNFIGVRLLAQMLSQRAQSYLLLDQPEKALQELTKLHHLSRLMEARPSSKPMTLIAAMINVAITGLYVSTITDGLHLHAWRDQELAALQQQLAEVDLLPYVHDALECEAVSFSHVAEIKSPRQMANKIAGTDGKKTFAEKIKDPTYLFVTLAPRGWVYQNFARAGQLEQGMLPGFDLVHREIIPEKVDQQSRAITKAFRHISPYTYIGARTVPNFSRAVQTAAKNQTLANEACIVCALERHHLAHGRYPASLDELASEFVTQFPNDLFGGAPLNYRVENGQFILYSVGWNERDDGGKPAWHKTGQDDLAQNDWVWPNQN